MSPLAGQPPDLGVDLARGQSLGYEAPGQMTLARGLRRVVALVGDSDDLLPQAEGE